MVGSGSTACIALPPAGQAGVPSTAIYSLLLFNDLSVKFLFFSWGEKLKKKKWGFLFFKVLAFRNHVCLRESFGVSYWSWDFFFRPFLPLRRLFLLPVYSLFQFNWATTTTMTKTREGKKKKRYSGNPLPFFYGRAPPTTAVTHAKRQFNRLCNKPSTTTVIGEKKNFFFSSSGCQFL